MSCNWKGDVHFRVLMFFSTSLVLLGDFGLGSGRSALFFAKNLVILSEFLLIGSGGCGS